MLYGNKTITVVNVYQDADADKAVYVCHTFSGCSWYSNDKVALDKDGMHSARLFDIRIPEASASGGAFYSPDAWQALTAEQKALSWTLEPGCKIICGSVQSMSAAEYAELSGPSVCTVMDMHDNRGKPMPHWYAKGG